MAGHEDDDRQCVVLHKVQEQEAQRKEGKGDLAYQVELACLTIEHNGHEKQCPGDGYAQGGG